MLVTRRRAVLVARQHLTRDRLALRRVLLPEPVLVTEPASSRASKNNCEDRMEGMSRSSIHHFACEACQHAKVKCEQECEPAGNVICKRCKQRGRTCTFSHQNALKRLLMSSADVTASTPTRQDYSWCNLPCDGRPASYHPHGPVPYHDMYVPPPEPALVDAPPWLAQPQYFTQPLPPHVDRQATVEELQQLRQELTLTTQLTLTIRQEISELHQTALAARELSELSTSAQATTRNDLSAIRNDISAITTALAPNRKSHCS